MAQAAQAAFAQSVVDAMTALPQLLANAIAGIPPAPRPDPNAMAAAMVAALAAQNQPPPAIDANAMGLAMATALNSHAISNPPPPTNFTPPTISPEQQYGAELVVNK